MAEDEMTGSLRVEWFNSDEEPFRPDKGTEIFIELEPEEKDESTFWDPDYLGFYDWMSPPYIPEFGKLPEFEAPLTELIINIETTGVKPWESKIICIGVLDPNALEPQSINFIEETEEETLNAFLEWFKTTEYSTLIGYNVSFDYRFLYAAMQKYRKNVPPWPDMELYDLMQQQKQVKSAYVFGFNPTGKLEEWATYLLGTKPYAEQKQVYKWFKERNVEEIVNFNSDKLVKAYVLWVLNKVVAGTIPGAEVLGQPSTPTTEAPKGTLPGTANPEEETISVQCPNCLQAQDMRKSDKVINCHVCGTAIANPAL